VKPKRHACAAFLGVLAILPHVDLRVLHLHHKTAAPAPVERIIRRGKRQQSARRESIGANRRARKSTDRHRTYGRSRSVARCGFDQLNLGNVAAA
jgi:hypothetical protein